MKSLSQFFKGKNLVIFYVVFGFVVILASVFLIVRTSIINNNKAATDLITNIGFENGGYNLQNLQKDQEFVFTINYNKTLDTSNYQTFLKVPGSEIKQDGRLKGIGDYSTQILHDNCPLNVDNTKPKGCVIFTLKFTRAIDIPAGEAFLEFSAQPGFTLKYSLPAMKVVDGNSLCPQDKICIGANIYPKSQTRFVNTALVFQQCKEQAVFCDGNPSTLARLLFSPINNTNLAADEKFSYHIYVYSYILNEIQYYQDYSRQNGFVIDQSFLSFLNQVRDEYKANFARGWMNPGAYQALQQSSRGQALIDRYIKPFIGNASINDGVVSLISKFTVTSGMSPENKQIHDVLMESIENAFKTKSAEFFNNQTWADVIGSRIRSVVDFLLENLVGVSFSDIEDAFGANGNAQKREKVLANVITNSVFNLVGGAGVITKTSDGLLVGLKDFGRQLTQAEIAKSVPESRLLSEVESSRGFILAQPNAIYGLNDSELRIEAIRDFYQKAKNAGNSVLQKMVLLKRAAGRMESISANLEVGAFDASETGVTSILAHNIPSNKYLLIDKDVLSDTDPEIREIVRTISAKKSVFSRIKNLGANGVPQKEDPTLAQKALKNILYESSSRIGYNKLVDNLMKSLEGIIKDILGGSSFSSPFVEYTVRFKDPLNGYVFYEIPELPDNLKIIPFFNDIQKTQDKQAFVNLYQQNNITLRDLNTAYEYGQDRGISALQYLDPQDNTTNVILLYPENIFASGRATEDDILGSGIHEVTHILQKSKNPSEYAEVNAIIEAQNELISKSYINKYQPELKSNLIAYAPCIQALPRLRGYLAEQIAAQFLSNREFDDLSSYNRALANETNKRLGQAEYEISKVWYSLDYQDGFLKYFSQGTNRVDVSLTVLRNILGGPCVSMAQ